MTLTCCKVDVNIDLRLQMSFVFGRTSTDRPAVDHQTAMVMRLQVPTSGLQGRILQVRILRRRILPWRILHGKILHGRIPHRMIFDGSILLGRIVHGRIR